MTDKMRILLDLDGVVFNVIEGWLKNYNEAFNDNVTPDDLTDFWLHKFCNNAPKEVIYGPTIITNEIMMTAPFYPGAKEKIEKLALGNDIVFVTSTFNHNRASRVKRLFQEFGGIDFDLVFTEDKSSVIGDLFVDDYIYHLEHYRKIHDETRCVLVRRPWNQKYDWDDCINELSELDPIIKSLL